MPLMGGHETQVGMLTETANVVVPIASPPPKQTYACSFGRSSSQRRCGDPALLATVGPLLLLGDPGKTFLRTFQTWRDRKRLAKIGESLIQPPQRLIGLAAPAQDHGFLARAERFREIVNRPLIFAEQKVQIARD